MGGIIPEFLKCRCAGGCRLCYLGFFEGFYKWIERVIIACALLSGFCLSRIRLLLY